MALNLVGLEQGLERVYQWLGDEAVDPSASDVAGWLGTGRGLVAKGGESPATFHVQALKPTTLQIVFNFSRMGASNDPSVAAIDQFEMAKRNMPAVYRAAVAYGVTAIDNAGAIRRVSDAGGMRLADDVLDAIDAMPDVIIEPKDDKSRGVRVRLMEHLGDLILSDSRATETEKKV